MLRSIILLYKKTESDIKRAVSGRSKFNLIASFTTQYERNYNSLPPFSLLKDFISILIDVILKSDINFTDPAKLNTAKHILNTARNEYKNQKSGDVIISQIDKATDILNMQMLKSYFYLGRYEDGLSVLNGMLSRKEEFFEKDERTTVRSKSQNDINAGKYAIVNPDIYKESKAYEILSEIKNELERLNSYSGESINILLVEEDSFAEGFSGGTVQNLLCKTKKKTGSKDSDVEIENITDSNDAGLKTSMTASAMAANKAIKTISGKSVPYYVKRSLRYMNSKGIYKGSSLGLGAAVVSACSYFSYFNKRRRYKISNAAAFTGAVESGGKVIGVNSATIKDKIEAAFFSWVKYCFVPRENLNEALTCCERLQKIYPEKRLEIFGIENVEEVFVYTEAIKTEEIGFSDFSRTAIKRHKAVSVSFAAALVIFSTFFVSTKFLPKDIKPLPKTESGMYLIYAPDRDTNWIFRNINYYGGDTINFGDAAIGDQWFPSIEFWNNAREKEEFDIFVDGKDKDEFQVTYIYKNEQPEAPPVINTETSQQIYVRFVPTKQEGSKSAELVFESRKTKFRKLVYLKGTSKRLSNGYCLDMADADDGLALEPGTNLLNDNFSVSFWIKFYDYKPVPGGFNIFYVADNPRTKNKMNIYVEGKEIYLSLGVPGSKSTELSNLESKWNFRLIPNEWNFIAITHTDTVFSLVVNDSFEKHIIPRNLIRKINDCIYFGRLHPSERTEDLSKLTVNKYYLDEFKIYGRYYTPEELIANRFNNEFGGGDLLAHYGFDDAAPKRVYDETTNDFFPQLYGGVTRHIDSTLTFGKKTYKEANKTGNTVLRTQYKGFARLNKNIYLPKSSFTYQCDIKDEAGKYFDGLEPATIYINRPELDLAFTSRGNETFISVWNNYKSSRMDKTYENLCKPGWNRHTITYDASKNEICFYINSKLIKKYNPEYAIDIAQNYMGASFGIANYYGAPRYSVPYPVYIDNIKFYNRAISEDEIFSDTRQGVTAYWTFENTDKELAYDEISGIPLLMIETFELINDNINLNR